MLISKLDNRDADRSIRAFEEKYGVTLPNDHKAFLLKYNGGYTPKTKIRAGRVSTDVRGLFGFSNGDPYLDILCFFKEQAVKDFLADKVLPVGSNVFGDCFLIGICDENKGNVYFRYHDRKRNDILIAESFKAFVDKCKSENVGHIPSIDERKALLRSNGNAHLINPAMIAGWQAEIDRYKNIVQEEVDI